MCRYLLGSLAPILFGVQHEAYVEVGVRTLTAGASRFFGSVTFLLVRSGFLAEMFPSTLEFLVTAMVTAILALLVT